MKCKEIEPLIYLFKPGEITENEQHLLDGHLKFCDDCRNLLEEVRHQRFTVNELTAEGYNTSHSSFYKVRIIEKIAILENGKSNKIAQKIKSNGLNYLSLPVYRYISAALIGGLVITFLLQNYSAYLNISKLEMKFGNPSTYEARAESKAIVLGDEDFSFIKESSQKSMKTGKRHSEFSLFKGSKFLLISMRKHRFFQELANHNPGIDPADIIRIYNKSVYLGESRRNQN
jgi:hypothetical protein